MEPEIPPMVRYLGINSDISVNPLFQEEKGVRDPNHAVYLSVEVGSTEEDEEDETPSFEEGLDKVQEMLYEQNLLPKRGDLVTVGRIKTSHRKDDSEFETFIYDGMKFVPLGSNIE